MQVRGNIDQCSLTAIEGWIYDADQPGQRLRLEVFAGGVAIGECVADVFRPDLAAAGLGDGHISYRFAMPAFLRDPLYVLLARNRYRWFGQLDACRVPTAEMRSRFLD